MQEMSKKCVKKITSKPGLGTSGPGSGLLILIVQPGSWVLDLNSQHLTFVILVDFYDFKISCWRSVQQGLVFCYFYKFCDAYGILFIPWKLYSTWKRLRNSTMIDI